MYLSTKKSEMLKQQWAVFFRRKYLRSSDSMRFQFLPQNTMHYCEQKVCLHSLYLEVHTFTHAGPICKKPNKTKNYTYGSLANCFIGY